MSEQHIMEMAAIFGVLWCISVLSFMFSNALSIPAYINPLLLYIFMALFLLNPTKTFRHEARFWTIKIISRVICAPFFYVNFADFWVSDEICVVLVRINKLSVFLGRRPAQQYCTSILGSSVFLLLLHDQWGLVKG